MQTQKHRTVFLLSLKLVLDAVFGTNARANGNFEFSVACLTLNTAHFAFQWPPELVDWSYGRDDYQSNRNESYDDYVDGQEESPRSRELDSEVLLEN